MGSTPPPGMFKKIADFSQSPVALVFAKAPTLDSPKGRLVYKNLEQSLYLSTVNGTVMILR